MSMIAKKINRSNNKKRKRIAGIKLLIFACVFLAPAWSMLTTIFNKDYSIISYLSEAVSARRLALFWRSATFSLLTGMVSICFALIIAIVSVFSKNKRRVLEKLQYVSITLFLIPSCIHVQGWLSFYEVFHLPLQGFFPALWVSSIYYLPLALLLITIVTKNISTQELEAAKVYMPKINIVIKVITPTLKPIIIVCWTMITLLSIGDYSIPSLFNVNVVALDIVSEYSFSGYSPDVVIIAVPMMLLGIVLVTIGAKSIQQVVTKSNAYQQIVTIAFNAIIQCVYYVVVGIVTLAVVLLTGNILAFVTDFQNALGEVFASMEQFGNTVLLSGCAAVIAQVVAYYYTKHLLTKDYFFLSISLLLILLIIPSSLFGINLLNLFKNTFLYGSIVLPMIALAIRLMPVAVFIYYAFLKSMNPNIIDASRVYRQRYLKHLFKIEIPLLLPMVIANIGLLFVLSIGEVGITMMTIPPGFNTITIKLYNYLHYGASETVAALSVCMIVITVVPTLFIFKWIKRKLNI